VKHAGYNEFLRLAAAIAQRQIVRLSIGRLGARSTAIVWIAADLKQERSPQLPRQQANFRLRPAPRTAVTKIKSRKEVH